ncbi:hypothetical protein BC832DRAFT_590980 [Gaertneriomyces semiglobifer]|nr:hypothetical protein BC832DRAFT_590980 [Gaertneriomyces semiglobifer]
MLREPSSIRQLVTLFERPHTVTLWPYRDLLKRIHFLPPTEPPGSDSGVLSKSHSSLFRLLLEDGRLPENIFVHKLFITLASCPNLQKIQESFDDGGWEMSPASIDPRLLTQTVIQNVLASCRHVATFSTSVGDMKPGRLVRVCILLHELLEATTNPMWSGMRVCTQFRLGRNRILEKCRIGINRLSTAVHLESQYIALAAQRVLDHYVLVHFRMISHSRDLDAEFLLATAACDNQEEGQSTATADDTIVATRILESIRLIFRRDLIGHRVNDREFIQEVLAGMVILGRNAETLELVEHILETLKPWVDAQDDNSAAHAALCKWFIWLQDVVRWHAAGIELQRMRENLHFIERRTEYFRRVDALVARIRPV